VLSLIPRQRQTIVSEQSAAVWVRLRICMTASNTLWQSRTAINGAGGRFQAGIDSRHHQILLANQLRMSLNCISSLFPDFGPMSRENRPYARGSVETGLPADLRGRPAGVKGSGREPLGAKSRQKSPQRGTQPQKIDMAAWKPGRRAAWALPLARAPKISGRRPAPVACGSCASAGSAGLVPGLR
jgi:hypothetical protein